jgi:hypothetical protein
VEHAADESLPAGDESGLKTERPFYSSGHLLLINDLRLHIWHVCFNPLFYTTRKPFLFHGIFIFSYSALNR